MFKIRSFVDFMSETATEKVSTMSSLVQPRQALSVREILNKFVYNGETFPGSQDEQYGEDPTARPDYDLIDAKDALDGIEQRENERAAAARAADAAAAEANLEAKLRKKIAAETKPADS